LDIRFRLADQPRTPGTEGATVPTPREQLASILKQSRVEAGFDSHGVLAKRLNVSRPVVSKAENPAQPVPSDALLAAWAGVTGVPLDSLRDLAQRAKSGTPEWFMPYLTAEAAATTLRFWGALVVPGLLQIEGYARAYEQSADVVAARLERQRIIGRTRVTAVIDHTVLLRCIGSPQVMADQCAHLSALAESRAIRLHVVPEGANVGLAGAFGIAAKDGMATVSLTTAIRDVTSTAADVVDDTLNLFEVILGASLPTIASLEFLRTQEETWKTRI
jgi:transcriptional regulator with XRE-family HTH domain